MKLIFGDLNFVGLNVLLKIFHLAHILFGIFFFSLETYSKDTLIYKRGDVGATLITCSYGSNW